MKQSPVSQIPYLPLVLIGLLVLTLVPGRYLRWTDDVAEPLNAVLAPFTDVGRSLAAFLRPAKTSDPGAGDDVALSALRQELEQFRTQNLNLRTRQRQLLLELEELRRARDLNPEIRDRLLDFPVIRTSADPSSSIMKIKGGSKNGIIPGVVAVYRGVHLVGRITAVQSLTSSLQPVTDKNVEPLNCVVMPAENQAELIDGARCQVVPHPTRPDLLIGDVERDADWLSAIGEERLLVRLSDAHWPDGAQALIVGTVERVFTDDATPLRLRIEVRPVYHPLTRLPEVTLRLPEAPAALPGTAAGDTEEEG
jgi:rod shape-determining protein MreC